MARRSTPKAPAARVPDAAPRPATAPPEGGSTAKTDPVAAASAPAAGEGATSLVAAPSTHAPPMTQPEPSAAPAAEGDAATITEAVADFGRLAKPEIGDDQVQFFADLSPAQWGDLAQVHRDALTAMAEAAIAELNAAQVATAAQARRFLDADELEALTVRSRDGKPFRRAGFEFGDIYITVQANADQAARIRGDRGLQIKPAD